MGAVIVVIHFDLLRDPINSDAKSVGSKARSGSLSLTLSRFGVAQYNINSVNPYYIEDVGLNVSDSTVVSGRLSQYQSGALTGNPAGEPHLMTAFNFDTKLLHAKTFAPEG